MAALRKRNERIVAWHVFFADYGTHAPSLRIKVPHLHSGIAHTVYVFYVRRFAKYLLNVSSSARHNLSMQRLAASGPQPRACRRTSGYLLTVSPMAGPAWTGQHYKLLKCRLYPHVHARVPSQGAPSATQGSENSARGSARHAAPAGLQYGDNRERSTRRSACFVRQSREPK